MTLIDAPVSGSKVPAEQGQLTIFASGPDEARSRLAPLFDALGQRTIWVGPVGAGSRLKLVANSWLALAAEAVNTSVALARRLGLETETVVDALGGGPLVSPWQAAKLQRITQDDFSVQFALSLALKDVHLASQAAGDDRFRALAGLADEWQQVVDQGLGDDDLTVVTRALEDIEEGQPQLLIRSPSRIDSSPAPRRSSHDVTSYLPAEDRYSSMTYRRCGRSGLLLPAVSLGLWQNFGDDRPMDTQRAIVRRAFDLGITHFDLANNYGPPYGSAETNFGRILHEDFRDHRDELLISTKAGWDMWPGPYGDLGSRKYLVASLDQSLRRLGLDYVDIFYHHHFDPQTPLEESLGALHTAVTSGKALYVGISSYSDERTAEAVTILRQLGTPLLIHQPSYSMFNRWIEDRLLDVLDAEGVGCIAFSVLAQGLLSDRYLNGIPPGSRASLDGSLTRDMLNDENLARIRALNDIALGRGQSLAQMAIAWALRDPRVTSVLIGASSVAQLEQNVAALDHLEFTADELATIDRYAVDGGIDLWRTPATS